MSAERLLQDDGRPPAAEYRLARAQGYNGHLGRQNLAVTAAGTLLYPVGGLAVAHAPAADTQAFFRGHGSAVSCLTLHPDGRTVATGQAGPEPAVCVWDGETRKLLARLVGGPLGVEQVAAMAFSACGTRLLVVGGGQLHTVAAFDWRRQKLLAAARATQAEVLAASAAGVNRWHPWLGVQYADGTTRINAETGERSRERSEPTLRGTAPARFVTAGAGHLKFWALQEGTKGAELRAVDGKMGDRPAARSAPGGGHTHRTE
jgi:hypothetical protein